MSETPHPAALQVDPLEAEELARAGAVLLDVREADEFSAGHAPRSVHLPLGEVGAGAGALPRGVPVVCVCRSGARSANAAALLAAQGLDARNLAGGLLAWAAEGLPLERDGGGMGAVL